MLKCILSLNINDMKYATDSGKYFIKIHLQTKIKKINNLRILFITIFYSLR